MQTSIITQQNIFDPAKRLIATTQATHSSEILDTLLIDKGFEVAFYKNSEFMPEPFEIKEGDIINIVFIPQGGGSNGKSIISLVAMVAVAVFAPQFVGATGAFGEGGALAGYGLGLTGFAGSLATAGVVLAGGLLVNAVLAPNVATSSFNSDLATSSTYSWEASYNKFTQGTPVPVVFGTHKVTPPLLSKYIESNEDMQYFNGLYALNDGEITNISNIKINGEDIENFNDVSVDIRYGTLNQALIPSFDNTRSDNPVSKKLSTNYALATTNESEVIAVSITLCFPRGIYHVNNSGNLEEYSVKIVMEYSIDGVTWIRFGGDTEVTGFWYLAKYFGDYDSTIEKYTAYSGTFIENVSSLPSDAIRYTGGNKYQEWYYTPSYINPYTTIKNSTSSTFRKTYRIANLTPSAYQVRLKFYEEPLSSSRYASTCYFEYLTQEIGDDFIYPTTALIAIRALATDQLSGNNPVITCNVTANSNNPSLICQKIAIDCGEEPENLLESFEVWEEYCNTKELYFNGVFDSLMSVRKRLDMVGLIGRGSVQQFGTRLGVVIDKEEIIPSQGFTVGVGNILKDSLEISYLSLSDRANVIVCTYWDAQDDYNPTVIQKSLGGYDNVSEDNKVEISLPGCTSRTQAIRQCIYQLKINRIITQSGKLKVDKDGLWSQYGDIVSLSSPIIGYGKSGRIVSCSSTDVVLDQEVELESGKLYYIQLRDDTYNIAYHDIVNTGMSTNTLTFVEELENNTYKEYDNYQFGEYGKANKLYRLLKIATHDDATRTLQLLEYNESVYDDLDDDFNIININSIALTNLFATDYIKYTKDGTIETIMQLSWTGASLYYTVKYKKSSQGIYTSITAYKSSLDIVVEDTSYDIIVTDMKANSISLTYAVQGKTTPPDPITNLTCNENGNIFELKWDYTPPADFKEFIIYLEDEEIGRTTTYAFGHKSLGTSLKKFSVKVMDTTNNYSDETAITISAGVPLSVSGLSVDFSQEGILLNWNASSDDDFWYYEVRDNDGAWGDANALYKGALTLCTITPTTNKTYHIKQCDTGENYSAISSIAVTLPKPSTPANITAQFSDTTSSMADMTLNWDDSISEFGISHYKVAYGTKNITIKASELKVTADWDGDRVFTITAYDSFGFASTTATKTVTKALPNPPLNFRFQVIDNNVLFYWDEPTITTLPITSYELRRGVTWDSAELIGKKSGGFTTVFESVGGNFTYWIASIDSDNRYSLPTSVTCTVSQPPDFILNVSNVSTFSGTKNNMLLENGYLLANIDTAKTWATHFSSRGWTTPQNQINAGYPIFIQPTLTAGYYEETIDLGTTLASSRITVSLSTETLAGVISTICDISVSNNGTTWTTYTNMAQVFATNFRYYKFKINVSATTATGLCKITNITSVLDSKLKNDGGTQACLSTDAGGTVVAFNMPFVDIISITVTPQGTTPITAIYDFVDTPNPTSFKILLFNQSGTRVSGNASWSVKGY